mgnify:CR=1 FL=1
MWLTQTRQHVCMIKEFLLSAPLLWTSVATNAVSTAPISTLSGKAVVTDGDSLRIDEARIRLYGIDAVEGRQTCLIHGQDWACGKASKRALTQLVGGQTVTCAVKDVDKNNRFVSVCYSNSVDLSEVMVRNGWALAYRRFSTDYVSAENDARVHNRGIWRASFERPHEYRARLRKEAMDRAPQSPPSLNCDIKGNISRSSKNKIYHMPHQADYAKTRISEKAGERWFCSEQEALKAGWRPAKR